MAAALPKPELLERVLRGVDASDAQALIIRGTHPFSLRVFRNDSDRIDACVFIWNITHGGGSARPEHEFRIQLTGVVPSTRPGEHTFLLGWHEGWGVFVAFDMRRHENQSSSSPSIQVPRETLLGAHTHAFATHMRGNRETVVAFRPEYLVDYMLAADGLHGASATATARPLLNNIDTADEAEIEAITDQKRRVIVASIKRRFRKHDFRARVLGAYAHRCAMCGMQLRLVEAAHILPVPAERSTDETSNGVALCATHHKAFDANLVSFDERYEICISDSRVRTLAEQRLADRLKEFRDSLLPALVLPADRRDYPAAKYITESRRVRRWVS